MKTYFLQYANCEVNHKTFHNVPNGIFIGKKEAYIAWHKLLETERPEWAVGFFCKIGQKEFRIVSTGNKEVKYSMYEFSSLKKA